MLYPKREQVLTPADFKNPSSEYRATPFWAWNNKLDKEELIWQIEQLKKMGIVAACVEKARKKNACLALRRRPLAFRRRRRSRYQRA